MEGMVGTDVVLECAGEESGTFIVGMGATEGRVGIWAFLSELVNGRGLAGARGSSRIPIAGFPTPPVRSGAVAWPADTLISGTSGGLGVVLRLGISGARPLAGSGGLISGTEGGLGVVLLWGISGARLMVGTSGVVAACTRGGGPDFGCSEGRGAGSEAGEITSSSLTTFQSFLKDTIGRPGASETAVGVGSLGLRSLRRKPVAARSSSLRISFPSFIFTSGSFSAFALSFSDGFGTVAFNV